MRDTDFAVRRDTMINAIVVAAAVLIFMYVFAIGSMNNEIARLELELRAAADELSYCVGRHAPCDAVRGCWAPIAP